MTADKTPDELLELPDTGMREIVIDSIDACVQLMMAMDKGGHFMLAACSNTGLTGNQRRLTFLKREETIASLKAENEELDALFERMWAADMRGIKMWQKKTGKELTWPSRDKLVLWLLERIDELEGGQQCNTNSTTE